jgi:hypothetical protein
MNFKNWKTSSFAVATVIAYVVGYRWPQHKPFIDGLITLLVAGGLLSAKDFNVTGTK